MDTWLIKAIVNFANSDHYKIDALSVLILCNMFFHITFIIKRKNDHWLFLSAVILIWLISIKTKSYTRAYVSEMLTILHVWPNGTGSHTNYKWMNVHQRNQVHLPAIYTVIKYITVGIFSHIVSSVLLFMKQRVNRSKFE